LVSHTILERGLCLLYHCLVLLSGSRVLQVLEERVREVPGDDGGDDEARDDQDAQVEVVVASAGGARLGHHPRLRHLLTAVFHQFRCSDVQISSVQFRAGLVVLVPRKSQVAQGWLGRAASDNNREEE
jgi:hypothetical protein